MQGWLECLKSAEKTCIVEGGKKKVHYKFSDGKEMAEEYNLDTQVVTRRAWKKEKAVGEPEWEIEIGDPSLPKSIFDSCDIRESSSEPVVTARITRTCLEWRIRNLPYPIEVYNVSADEQQRCIIVRTTNKKFFKKIIVHDLERLQLPIEQDRISCSHKYNTLIISYKKPSELIAFEKILLEEIKNLQHRNNNPLQCPTS